MGGGRDPGTGSGEALKRTEAKVELYKRADRTPEGPMIAAIVRLILSSEKSSWSVFTLLWDVCYWL